VYFPGLSCDATSVHSLRSDFTGTLKSEQNYSAPITPMIESRMRFVSSSEIQQDFVPAYPYRKLLQDNVGTMKDGSDQGAAFLMFVAIVVGVSGMFLYCSFYLIKFWLCGRGRRDISRISDNFSFSLGSQQRRDILETIFSDASKASTTSKTIDSVVIFARLRNFER
jgi:hypothetical protein